MNVWMREIWMSTTANENSSHRYAPDRDSLEMMSQNYTATNVFEMGGYENEDEQRIGDYWTECCRVRIDLQGYRKWSNQCSLNVDDNHSKVLLFLSASYNNRGSSKLTWQAFSLMRPSNILDMRMLWEWVLEVLMSTTFSSNGQWPNQRDCEELLLWRNVVNTSVNADSSI